MIHSPSDSEDQTTLASHQNRGIRRKSVTLTFTKLKTGIEILTLQETLWMTLHQPKLTQTETPVISRVSRDREAEPNHGRVRGKLVVLVRTYRLAVVVPQKAFGST